MITGIDFNRVFKIIPYNSMLLRANAPVFTIVDVTDFHLQTLGQTRMNLVGRGLFDVFPLDSNTNSHILFESLVKVADTGERDHIPVIHYDIPEGGTIKEKYWSVENIPYTETDKRQYILNFALDITEVYKAGFLNIK